jgi:hypothetical protein
MRVSERDLKELLLSKNWKRTQHYRAHAIIPLIRTRIDGDGIAQHRLMSNFNYPRVSLPMRAIEIGDDETQRLGYKEGMANSNIFSWSHTIYVRAIFHYPPSPASPLSLRRTRCYKV